jgi:peptidoglycan/LPS O-acetylase OafA/YrhL
MGIKEKAKQKSNLFDANFKELIKHIRNEPRYRALLALQFLLILALSIGIYFYADPAINIMPWPFNFFVFALLLLILLVFSSKRTKGTRLLLGSLLFAILATLLFMLNVGSVEWFTGFLTLILLMGGIFYIYEYTHPYRGTKK